jgi:hypothetical protein
MYLDSHPLWEVTEEQIRQAHNAPIGDDSVKSINIMYNREENKLFCLTDAPSREAVEKHYHILGVRCDWITEVKTTA